jgi:hypothetical protein
LIFGTLGNQSAGTYTTTVTVSDGVHAVPVFFTWTVTDVTVPVLIAPNNQANREGALIALQLQASDGDGDPLTYSASGLPAGLSINPATGLISGTISHSASQVNGGLYTVSVSATDGWNTASQAFTWTISSPGDRWSKGKHCDRHVHCDDEHHHGHGLLDQPGRWLLERSNQPEPGLCSGTHERCGDQRQRQPLPSEPGKGSGDGP